MNYRKSEAKEAARAQFRGVWAAGPVRAPRLPLTDAERQALRTDLEQTGILARVPAAHQVRAA